MRSLGTLISSGASSSHRNTDDIGQGGSDDIGGKVEPFATATTARAIGLQQFDDAADDDGCQPCQEQQTARG